MRDSIAGIKRTNYYIPETVIALAILVAINVFFFPDRPSFEGVIPNPFWIIVLAIPIRYGRRAALFSGLLSAAVFLAYYVIQGGIDAIYDDLWMLRFPFIYVLVSFMLGEVKTSFILREEYLTKRLNEVEDLNNRLKKENEIVQEAHGALTEIIAGKQDTITSLNEITERLKSNEPEIIFNGILESLRQNLGAEECSYYEAQDSGFKLYKSAGWKEYHRRRDHYERGQGLIGIAGQKLHEVTIKDIVSKRRAEDAPNLDIIGDSILAVPVIGVDRKLYGVASVEKLPLLKLTDTAILTAKVICDLAAASLSSAEAFRKLEEGQIHDDNLGIYKYHYFLERLNEEVLRAVNYSGVLSVMAFKWSKFCGLSDEKLFPIIKSIITVLKAKFKPFDIIACGPTCDMPLVSLLVATSAHDAELVKKDMVERLKNYGFETATSDAPLEKTIIISSYDKHKAPDVGRILRELGL